MTLLGFKVLAFTLVTFLAILGVYLNAMINGQFIQPVARAASYTMQALWVIMPLVFVRCTLAKIERPYLTVRIVTVLAQNTACSCF